MNRKTRFSIWYYVAVLLGIFLLQTLFFSGSAVKEISYNEFRDKVAAGDVESVVITDDRIHGMFKAPVDSTAAPTASTKASSHKITPANKPTPWRLRLKQIEEDRSRRFEVVRLQDDELLDLLQTHGVDYRGHIESRWFHNVFLNWILPFVVLMLVWGFLLRRLGAGPSALNIGKSRAKIYASDQREKVTFGDVAGVDEAVEEVKELVDFLKTPQKYTRLGGKLPKGILLIGPPGTGKTLLARAVAGEAGVPFFSLSGSDFVEMFVGVGAARVRDLFAEAKLKAPCIIFIDEIDAVGKSRAQSVVWGGHDERESTLQQLLVEMDGFDTSVGVILIAATNRPEVLDAALLRPGRFDRQILVDRPDLSGRVAVFEVHTRGLTLTPDVDLKKLAAQTPGFAGAEIANVCNEAALLASRRGTSAIEMADFEESIERVVAGLQKKNKLINDRERRIVAYHECGHAIVGHFTPGADPVHKVSIVPRGMGALGYTLQTPLEDRYLMSREELLGKIKGLLGGRAAEEIAVGEVSTGASNDLERVAKIAREMVTVYGMSKRMPNVSLVDREQPGFLMQEPRAILKSEKIERIVGDEIMEIIETCFAEATSILRDKRDLLERMAKLLQEKETLNEADITAILGPRAA